ncbi:MULTISPECIES: patatin-like phospholipase family protein [unclassified Phyllobacterium]|uniref:patatin-like phospholipase family protein n=1 Tax=Phyllobacterium TaxID=28100 RepID=UPI000DDFE7CE|nr:MULTISPECIES: patatin-like phospholipase family protein [unclassified Phyllobacterium]MBA8900082.1 NTE family protein [Phyllobacterium sp. P30BS-XVII]UGX86041.1 patatin-like phospholipase family protein [Phyllobacterium sp. T1293]
MNHKPKAINIALQGGGSHGAFTWGVLDRILEDGRLTIEGISGTSAGAMNAVALADGWSRNGAEGAREKLHEFWRAVGRTGQFSPVQRTPWDRFFGNWSVENGVGYNLFEQFSRMFSPYEFNPFNLNPLRDVVEREIDFDRVKACSQLKLFISATNVESGRLRVFSQSELNADVVMASACLPYIFQAVEIGGEPYWDGGYGGNPALYPFFYSTKAEDVLLIQINPIERRGAPKTAREITDRIDEITFNAALLREFRSIAFVNSLIDGGRLEHGEYKHIRMHRIDADVALAGLAASSKINAEWAFLEYLRDLGQAAADDWLEEHFDAIGEHATLDLSDELSPEMNVGLKAKKTGRRVTDFLLQRKKPVGAARRRA